MDLYGNIFHVASVECDFEFADVIQQEKKELLRRLLDVYFKDEPTIYEMIKDDDKWEEYFGRYSLFQNIPPFRIQKCPHDPFSIKKFHHLLLK